MRVEIERVIKELEYYKKIEPRHRIYVGMIDAIALISKLEEKAAKWDMIKNCIKNKQNIGKKVSVIEIAEIVAKLYEESETE